MAKSEQQMGHVDSSAHETLTQSARADLRSEIKALWVAGLVSEVNAYAILTEGKGLEQMKRKVEKGRSCRRQTLFDIERYGDGEANDLGQQCDREPCLQIIVGYERHSVIFSTNSVTRHNGQSLPDHSLTMIPTCLMTCG